LIYGRDEILMIYALIKIYDNPKFTQDLIAGNLFMRKLKGFKGMKKDDNYLRADKHEGNSVVNQPETLIISVDNHKIDSKDLKSPVTIYKEKTGENFIYSMYAMNSGIFDKIEKHEVNLFKKNLEIDKAINDFGNEAVLITNLPEFIRRIELTFKKLEIPLKHGLVKYYDYEKENINLESKTPELYKRKEYAYQHEYRLIAEIDSKQEYKKINIGNISDISMKINMKSFNSLLEIELHE
jgi:hypothetical protein